MNRRALLKTAPLAFLAGAAPALAVVRSASDPIIALCDAWVAAYREWNAETDKDDGGNFDTPRHQELDIVKDRLIAQMKATPITTDAGCLAFWRYLAADNCLHDESSDFPDVQRWQLTKLHEWAEARALIA